MFNLIVLCAAIIYAISALFIKRASELGAGAIRTLVVSNTVCAVIFLPLSLLGGTFHLSLWWQPVIVAICFISGQWFTFISLKNGDVSIATPVLGSKIILVAIFTILLTNIEIQPTLWGAAVLATISIAILNKRSAAEHHHVTLTIITSILSAASYALFDVLVQKWASTWGLGYFLPLTIGIAAIISCLLIPKFEATDPAQKSKMWQWLIVGAILISSQSLLIVSSIAYWQNATQANVIYSSRGLWSILIIWGIGHWFSSKEQNLGNTILLWRLFGAFLMMIAILLALF